MEQDSKGHGLWITVASNNPTLQQLFTTDSFIDVNNSKPLLHVYGSLTKRPNRDLPEPNILYSKNIDLHCSNNATRCDRQYKS